jgi:hypothetical protein
VETKKMRKDMRNTCEYSNDIILSVLSREDHLKDKYVVFIKPNGIVSPEKDIERFDLYCSVECLNSEEMIVENYEDKDEAIKRVKDFLGHLDNYYVSLWNNGDFLYSTEKQ